ncbi:MAG: hypothetical protein JWP46_2579 [Modestobacter sp.]|nr:hypothetical protein [Modestobacter sp.]
MADVGRRLVAAAVAGSAVGAAGADLNRTHAFNPQWMPHARFHSVVGVTSVVGWSLTSLWLLWRPGSPAERELGLRVTALTPVLSYGPFFLALVVPGAGVEDRPGDVPRVAGVPANILVAGVLTAVSTFGYSVARREARREARRAGPAPGQRWDR